MKWPRLPTFPRSEAVLDIILMDGRIELQTLDDNYKVKSIPHDSDHNAISAIIKSITDTDDPTNVYNFKGTDWQEFKKHVAQNNLVSIPSEQNLSNEEIDNYIQKLEAIIRNSMENVIPKCKKTNATDKFLNKKIKQLQKDKIFLLTQIHKEKYSNRTRYELKLSQLKNLLVEVKKQLYIEFSGSVSEY